MCLLLHFLREKNNLTRRAPARVAVYIGGRLPRVKFIDFLLPREADCTGGAGFDAKLIVPVCLAKGAVCQKCVAAVFLDQNDFVVKIIQFGGEESLGAGFDAALIRTIRAFRCVDLDIGMTGAVFISVVC